MDVCVCVWVWVEGGLPGKQDSDTKRDKQANRTKAAAQLFQAALCGQRISLPRKDRHREELFVSYAATVSINK